MNDPVKQNKEPVNTENCSIRIDEVYNETNLIDYTDDHFNTMILNDLASIKNHSFKSTQYPPTTEIHYDNSPIMSINGSDSGESNIQSIKERKHKHLLKKYKHLSNKDIESYIDKHYSLYTDNKYSTEIDILTTFARGQKNIYIQSKKYTENILNFMMFSSLGFTSIITIVTPYYCVYEWNSILITTMNAIIILFLSLINYLKLESKCEKFLQLSIVFDTIETSLEVTNSKLIFINDDTEKSTILLKKLQYFENKIIHSKNKNIILIPDIIKNIFPMICTINIFSLIKKTEKYRKKLTYQLKNIKNEISFIMYQLNKSNRSTKINSINENVLLKENSRLQYLHQTKKEFIQEILVLRSIYGLLDDLFTKEIKDAESNQYLFLFPFFNKKKVLSKEYLKNSNPIILKHFISIGLINNDDTITM